MLRQSFIYGGLLATFYLFLKLLEIASFSSTASWNLKSNLLAILFFGLGAWFTVVLLNQKKILPKEVHKLPINEQSLLSQREFEVLQGMADGLSNKEIAEELFLSENTIKTHASNLYSKLDVKRRTQAVQKARTLTLIS